MVNSNREIEVRFLEIDKLGLINKLHSLGAEDKGEEKLREIIFYDKDLQWGKVGSNQYVRLRSTQNGIYLTYKQHVAVAVDGAIEYEVKVSDLASAKEILQAIGLVAYREQEKMRHRFILDDVMVDIIDWPKIPTLVELEGESEQALKTVAEKLELDWNNVTLGDNRSVIENRYHIPISKLKYFTFDKIE